jgi:molecular chaperone DnaK (HSP70)
LGSAWEHIGGRDINEALVQHFLKQAQEKSGNPEIGQNPRVLAKLRIQVGKTKETLSASKEASFTLQNLDGDFDFSGTFFSLDSYSQTKRICGSSRFSAVSQF